MIFLSSLQQPCNVGHYCYSHIADEGVEAEREQLPKDMS